MLMENKINKKKVGTILTKFGAKMVGNAEVLKADGSTIDIKKLMAHAETKKAIEALKECGVKSNKDLFSLGFVAGGMLLRF